MIGIAFLSLLLSLIMQTGLLQRATARERQLRAEAELRRAEAVAETQRARAILDQFRQQVGKR
jgi:hypothetical protein